MKTDNTQTLYNAIELHKDCEAKYKELQGENEAQRNEIARLTPALEMCLQRLKELGQDEFRQEMIDKAYKK